MTTHPSISAVIISCNEADVIEECLQSVVGWVDEIVVVDMHSTDGTQDIVQRYPVRLVDHERLAYADPARNMALAQATGEWILMLDPDERVPEHLAHELRRIAGDAAVDVVLIPRQVVMFGRAVRSPGVSDTTQTRFFRGGVILWPPEVHGRPDLTGLRCCDLSPHASKLSIRHDSWRSVAGVLDKILRYTPNEVEKLQADGKHFSAGRLLYAVCFNFVRHMALGRAYEDGVPGLLGALYSAVYQLTIHAALWEAEGYPSRYDRQIAQWGRWMMWPLKGGYHVVFVVREAVRFTRRPGRSGRPQATAP